MEPGFLLQLLLVIIGGVLLCFTITSLARKSITEPFSLSWGLVSVVIILGGILLRPAGWNRYVSKTGLVLAVMIVLCFIFGIFFITVIVSGLMRKVNEMAIDLSLLIQEKEELQSRIGELKGELDRLKKGEAAGQE